MSASERQVRDKTQGRMTINVPGVIKTLGEAMYTDPWVALRELIQNANDSCIVRRAPRGNDQPPPDPAPPPAEIRIHYDSYGGVLVVEDNGTGLSWEEVERFLSVIGHSETDQVRSRLEAMGERSWADRLIGRFGLGLLSAFIVGDAVEFETRSYKPDSKTVWWRCDGGQHYERGVLDTEREVGTRVTIHVDPAHRSMFQDEVALKTKIRRFADLLEIPIYFGKTGMKKINVGDAPWLHHGTTPEYLEYLQGHFPDDAILHVIPVEIDEPATDEQPALRVGGALLVPKQPDPLRAFVREYGAVTVYVRRMFVTENDSFLLPPWARFIKGVIDSPDLRETTSRESLRDDDNLRRVRAALGELILRDLHQLSRSDQRLFREIAAQHNVVIKIMAIEHSEFFDAVKNLVLFKVDNRAISLQGYFEEADARTDEAEGDRRTIYYSSNVYGLGQHSFLFAQQGWMVIDASSYPDEPFLIAYGERYPDRVKLVPVDTAGDTVFIELQPKDEKWLNLEDAFLRNRIEARVVSFAPDDIPAVLVDPTDRELSDDQIEQLLNGEELDIPEPLKNVFQEVKKNRSLRRRAMVGGGATLYLNADSEIVQRLAAQSLAEYETVDVMFVLYNNALMLSARALTADQAKKIFDGNNRTIKALMDKTVQIQELSRSRVDPEAYRVLQEQLKEQQRRREELDESVGSLKERERELEEKLEIANKRAEGLEEELNGFRARVAQPPESSYVQCFVIMPFDSRYDPLLAALRRVLETAPFFFRVIRADERAEKARIRGNVGFYIQSSHCYAVEISDGNPNAMMESGYAYWVYEDRPMLLLQREDKNIPLVDLGDAIRLRYPWPAEDQPLEERARLIEDALRRGISSYGPLTVLVEQAEQRYLSIHTVETLLPGLLSETVFKSENVARAASEEFVTVEDLLQAKVERVAKKVFGSEEMVATARKLQERLAQHMDGDRRSDKPKAANSGGR